MRSGQVFKAIRLRAHGFSDLKSEATGSSPRLRIAGITRHQDVRGLPDCRAGKTIHVVIVESPAFLLGRLGKGEYVIEQFPDQGIIFRFSFAAAEILHVCPEAAAMGLLKEKFPHNQRTDGSFTRLRDGLCRMVLDLPCDRFTGDFLTVDPYRHLRPSKCPVFDIKQLHASTPPAELEFVVADCCRPAVSPGRLDGQDSSCGRPDSLVGPGT